MPGNFPEFRVFSRSIQRRVLFGQERLVDRVLIGLLCNGHIRIEIIVARG